MNPRDFAAHMKAHAPADVTPVPVSAVAEVDPAARIAEVVRRARKLPLPDGHEMAVFATESFLKLLPAEGEAMDVATLIPLSGALRRMALCYRMAARYSDEKACDSVRDLADTVYRMLAP